MPKSSNWWVSDTLISYTFREDIQNEDYALLQKALSDGTTGSRGEIDGTPKFPLEEFTSKLKEIGLRLRWAEAKTLLFADAQSYVHLQILEYKGSPLYSGRWVSSTETRSRQIKDLVESWIQPIPEEKDEPVIHSFSRENGHYYVREVGALHDVFLPENYNQDVVEKYNYVVSELTKDEPRGRLVLLEGLPGTGKTRMVRSLVCDLMESSTCILVPPSLMDSLSGPEFAMTLVRLKTEGKHIVLILEDADDCLIAREKNKAAKASLSALLNLSDGIMGATLDLRVVVSTNQELEAIDRAILRPGRLLKRISVGALSPNRASEVYARLTNGEVKAYTSDTILAQVYEDAQSSE
ncbi:MAG: AAA family ATPase [Terrimicrobiaceae bacterium]